MFFLIFIGCMVFAFHDDVLNFVNSRLNTSMEKAKKRLAAEKEIDDMFGVAVKKFRKKQLRSIHDHVKKQRNKVSHSELDRADRLLRQLLEDL